MSVVLLSITYNLAASSCGPRFTLVNKGHSDSVNLRRSVMKIVGIIKYYTLNIVYIASCYQLGLATRNTDLHYP